MQDLGTTLLSKSNQSEKNTSKKRLLRGIWGQFYHDREVFLVKKLPTLYLNQFTPLKGGFPKDQNLLGDPKQILQGDQDTF